MIHIEDAVVRQLRTIVPVIWGSIVSFILQFVAVDLVPAVQSALESEAVAFAITATVIWGWYWVWSKVGHHIPDWLSRLVMGSEKEPTYR